MTVHRSVVPSNDWERFYPKSEYDTLSPRVKQHVLHFQIAHDQPTDTIKSLIRKAADAMEVSGGSNLENRLNRADQLNHRLTPLHIAVIKGNLEIVGALLAETIVKRAINSADEFKWTPLHHAAIGSRPIYDLLVQAGANREIRTGCGGSCDDLRNLINQEGTRNWINTTQYEGEPLSKTWSNLIFLIKRSTFGRELPCSRFNFLKLRDNLAVVPPQSDMHSTRQNTPSPSLFNKSTV